MGMGKFWTKVIPPTDLTKPGIQIQARSKTKPIQTLLSKY